MDKKENNRFSGSKTEENLHTALSGESQAYVRYKLFASAAKKDGYVEIENLFKTIAENEKEHAEIWFNYLGGVSTTEDNLNAAAGGEHFEWSEMYAEFAKTAKEEGFTDVAARFSLIANIEKEHEKKYTEKLEAVRNNTVFTAENEYADWICLNCGHIHKGKTPPEVCPACSHPKAYFKKGTSV
jgi:rubrerythrin